MEKESFFSLVLFPRSTLDMWPSIIDKARIGGLNTIQTYVFWNVHEPEQGKYDFKGRCDLVRFIKLIHEKGLYVTLRLGPFIQAEWNHGGLPYWLREVPEVYFRTNNEPFKEHTERYVRKILGMMKEEKLLASQGGPIILGQIENEYNAVQLAYKENGERYIKWAANLVESMKLGIPWVMCKQNNAPGNLINALMEGIVEILSRDQTDMTSRPYGPRTGLLIEDIAFSVARYFSKNGSHVNYYMYHGGTNFGRTSAHFVTTRDYDDAPLDEYGMEKAPKYGHLKHVHSALRLCKRALFWGHLRAQKLGPDTEVRYYEQPGTKVCAAFLSNNNTRESNTIKFKGQDYVLPSRSISILPDCKTVVYNTAQVSLNNLSGQWIIHGTQKVKWEKDGERKPLTWYKTYFETPEGENAVAIRMKGMGKGLIWVNGIGVGRYWMSFLSPLGEPTQTEYHIPRSFMKEEKKKNIYVGEDYPVSVKSWKREGPKIASRSKDMRLKAVMKCRPEKQMVAVEFASFGDPTGTCGNFTIGKCSASKSKEVVEKECLGKNHCSIVVARETFGDKGCPEIVKTLAVQVKCEKKEGNQDDEKKKKEDNDEEEEEDDEDDEEEDEENKDAKDTEKKNQDM
ncbi:Glycoside hydrolase 35 catalytic domain [Arabidopsis suecica]|uniref:beta-galactosidase n=1 Tax=Arabidopsis suecica TaxID=45249 RepID=A0A8T1YEA0_ARASU|nr:Glycoside hydrolase 35 catalytic domain [Arabidopsis suecica]